MLLRTEVEEILLWDATVGYCRLTNYNTPKSVSTFSVQNDLMTGHLDRNCYGAGVKIKRAELDSAPFTVFGLLRSEVICGDQKIDAGKIIGRREGL